MMLRERAVWVAVLGIALAGAAGLAAAQSARQHKTVQPKGDPAPDQAENPDTSTQVPDGPREDFPDPVLAAEPPAPPPAPAAETPAAQAAEAAQPPADQAEHPVEHAVQAEPTPTPPAPPVVPAKTPEGRKLQQETAALLQLAQDVKAELEKAGNNTLSVVALRKIDQIEKMSKSLREEMSRQQAGQGN